MRGESSGAGTRDSADVGVDGSGGSARRRRTVAGNCLRLLVPLATAVLLAGCLRLPIQTPERDIAEPPDGPYGDAVRAIRGTAGDWTGRLVLRDDASRSLIVQPLTVASEVAADGLHVVSHRAFTPTSVAPTATRATDVTWIDPQAGTLHLAAFTADEHRDEHYRIRAFSRSDRWNWILVADGRGDRDGVRVTLTRGGNRLSWRRDEAGADGQYRFRTLLTLDRDDS